MKQKMVIKVAMDSQKSKSKALEIAVGFSGVESAALGKDKDQIEVVADGVDPVKLTTKLRKSLARRTCLKIRIGMAYAELVSVSPADKKDETKDETKDNPVVQGIQPSVWSYGGVPHIYEVRDPYPACCSIM